MAEHNEFGQYGERLAAEYLQSKGYHILNTNWRPPSGKKEIDIIAEHQGTLVFVEVKSRRNKDFGEAYQAVDWRKRKNLVSAANTYVRMFRIDLPYRFDVVSVIGLPPNATVEHMERAFVPMARYY